MLFEFFKGTRLQRLFLNGIQHFEFGDRPQTLLERFRDGWKTKPQDWKAMNFPRPAAWSDAPAGPSRRRTGPARSAEDEAIEPIPQKSPFPPAGPSAVSCGRLPVRLHRGSSVRRLPCRDRPFGQPDPPVRIPVHHPEPHASDFFAGLCELYLRWRVSVRETAFLEKRYLPEDDETVLRARDLGAIRMRVAGLSDGTSGFLPYMIDLCVLQFQSGHSVDQTVSVLTATWSCSPTGWSCAIPCCATSPG